MFFVYIFPLIDCLSLALARKMVINIAVGRWKAPWSCLAVLMVILLKETNTSRVMKMANGMVQYLLVLRYVN